jgi:acetyl esterase/lipase
MRRILLSAVAVLAWSAAPVFAQAPAAAQPEVAPGAYRVLPAVPLYDGAAPWPANWPGLLGTPVQEVAQQNGGVLYNITEPSYTAYLPDAARNTRTAVVIAPGGGFRQLSIDSEGNRVAIWLAERGIAAFVVKYRLVQQAGPQFSMMARMQEIPIDVSGQPAVEDTRRTIALVRQKAAEYAIDPTRLVAIGFSAGAHAVSIPAFDENVAARPNYVAPIYGGPFGGIPPMPAADAPNALPPLFLAMAQDDPLVADEVRNFYAELFAKGYRPELHLYRSGGHGFGMNQTRHTSDHFIDQFYAWMRVQGLTQKPGDPDLRPVSRGRGAGPGGGRRGGGPGGGPGAPGGPGRGQ